MASHDPRERFEQEILPLLGAAYNLARWLLRDPHDAQDAVQDAMVRAYRYFHTQRGENSRAWLFTIVRNTCITWRGRNRPGNIFSLDTVDKEQPAAHAPGEPGATPESALSGQGDRDLLHRGLAALPVEFREVIVLRELEGLSYKEIATVVNVPLGTVMSRLFRGRSLLKDVLTAEQPKERQRG